MLAIVDLAEVENLALHHSTAGPALALDDIPIAMFLAVFEASVESQEHANQLTPNHANEKRLGLHYRRFATAPVDPTRFLAPPPHQNRRTMSPVEKVGLMRFPCHPGREQR